MQALLRFLIILISTGAFAPVERAWADDGPPPALSHVGARVLAALQAAAQQRGRTWGYSDDNGFGADWMLQTPSVFGKRYGEWVQAVACDHGADCNTDFGLKRCASDAQCGARGHCATLAATATRPGGPAEKLCIGHSDIWIDELYKLITSAERFVDVTSLGTPDGRYGAAIRNAITVLSKKPHAIVVRLLFGAFPVRGEVEPKKLSGQWGRDLQKSSRLRLYVGGYRSSILPPSWNHSKIVAVDGRIAQSGGHNQWTKQYLGINPVHDLTMRVMGSIAVEAHRFINAQWEWTCKNFGLFSNLTSKARLVSWGAGKVARNCPPMFDAASDRVAPATNPAKAAVFSVGRLAHIDPKHASNQSDAAILAALSAAQRTIRIVQQDIGPPTAPVVNVALGHWPEGLFEQIAQALKRGVDVRLIVSNLKAGAGGLPMSQGTYSNGYSTQVVLEKLRDYMAARPQLYPSGEALRELVCAKMAIAYYRYSDDESYPDNATIPNHAKTFLVDDQAFYIGSQNLYDADLTEHGFIVDHAPTAQSYLTQYWNPLWAASQRTRVSGAGLPLDRCVLKR
jgi:phosphatidylserine/phosphatidylglycerophosphate/cardiolipin synthase-like enzyme